MGNIKAFECSKCAKCCTNIRGRLGEGGSDSKLVPFVYEYTSRFNATLYLHEWEVPVLKKKARSIGFELKVNPFLVFWDDVNRVPVALNWTLDYENCPFLLESKLCSINEEKPLVCRAYPLFLGNLFNAIETGQPEDVDHGDCPNFVKFEDGSSPQKMRTGDFFNMMFNAYGDCFTGMLQRRQALKITVDLLFDLVKRGSIYPEIIAKDSIERIRKRKPLGFFELVKRKKPVLYKEAKKQIDGIYIFNSDMLEKTLNLAEKQKKGPYVV